MAETLPREKGATLGFVTAILAFTSWGLVPMYWKLLRNVPATEILAHRLIWSLVVSALLLTIQRRWAEIAQVFRVRRQLGLSVLSGALIGVNWLIFIWAVNSGHVLQTSLGYFITPLVSVLLGAFVLGERLRRLQWAAVGLAAIGVLALGFGQGAFPWVALGLCATFSLYALVRKISRADSLPGLFVESVVFAPLALGYGAYLAGQGTSSFTPAAPGRAALLAGSGIITALPLLWFAHAARHLKLSTLGLLQYIGPTLTFLLGSLLYREPFSARHLFTFGCIWIALAIYTIEGRRQTIAARRISEPEMETASV